MVLMATLTMAHNTSIPIALPNTIRFSCSELNIQRIDPYVLTSSPSMTFQLPTHHLSFITSLTPPTSLVTPDIVPSPHLHQFVGGNALAAHMDSSIDISTKATCTTCTFTQDFSNYWTAVLFFRARNGSFHRVPLMGNLWLENARGGMTVYYTAPYDHKTRVTAFKPGFRMLNGDPSHRSNSSFRNTAEYQSIAFRCFTEPWGPAPAGSAIGDERWDTRRFPEKPCPYGLRINTFFPTCWDGVNVDSPDHKSHVAYPAKGTFEDEGWECPDT